MVVEVPLLVEEEEVGQVLSSVQEVVEVEQEQVQEELQELQQQEQERLHHKCSRCSGSRSCAFCTLLSAPRPCFSTDEGTCAGLELLAAVLSRLLTPSRWLGAPASPLCPILCHSPVDLL